MAYSAGAAYLQIIPSFKGVERAIRDQARDIGAEIDRSVARALPDGMAEGTKKAREHGRKAGDDYSGAFANTLRQRLDKAFKQLPALELKGDSSEADKAIARIRKTLQEIRDQHIGLQIDDKTALAAVAELRRELKELNRQSTTVTMHANTAAAAKELDAVAELWDKQLTERFNRIGAESGDRFAEAFRKQVKAAEKNLPELSVRASTAEADEKLTEVRRELQALGHADIGIDLDDTEAVARLAALREQLRELARTSEDVRFTVNTTAALRELDKLDAIIHEREIAAQQAAAKAAAEAQREADKQAAVAAREADRAARDAARRAEQARRDALAQARRDAVAQAREDAKQAEQDLGEFGRRVRDQLDSAVGSLRRIDVDTGPAQKEIERLRGRMLALRDLRIGVDIDAGEATAEINLIRRQLAQLARGTRDIQVRADVVAAYGELTALSRLADKLDGRRIKMDVDLDKAASGVENIGKKAEVPLSRLGALISLGASLGTAIVPAAAAAAGALGFLGTAAGAALSGVGVAALGLFGVADAVKALNDYQLNAAKAAKSLGQSENQVANALAGVSSAERSLQRAREDAGFSAKRAAQQVEQARRAETRAEQDAVQAQKDLAAAIKEVRQEEEDRTLQLRDNEIAQREATLDLADAKKALDDLIANPRASKVELQRARDSYDERQLQLDKLGVAQKRLQDQQDEFNRTGIQGADKVVAAQKRVADSQQAVSDAQQSLANSIEDQHRQQQQSADAILSATENLAQAQRTLQQAYRGTEVAGGAALQNLQTAMDNLSPSGQRFARFIFGLKADFLSLRDAASDGFLPGLQTSIESVLPALPKVRTYISDVATELGNIAVKVTDAFGDEGWQRFFRFIRSQTVPTLEVLSDATLNVAAGTRDLFLALAVFNRPIGKGLVDMTKSFAQWAENLTKSEGYRDFLAYVREVGPDVVQFFIDVGGALANVAAAAAPTGKYVLAILDSIASLIKITPKWLLSPLIGLIAIFTGAVLALSGAFKAFKFAQELATGAVVAYNATVGKGVTGLLRFKTAQEAATVATSRMTVATEAASAAQAGSAVAAANSAVAAARMEQTVAAVSTTAGRAGTVIGSLAGVMSGPWTLSILGAAASLLLLSGDQARQTAQTDVSTEAFERLAEAIRRTGSIQSDESKETIRSSETLSRLAVDIGAIAKQAGDFDARLAEVSKTQGTLNQANILAGRSARDYATDVNTLARALLGNKDAQAQLLQTLESAAQAAQLKGDKKLADEARNRREELVKLFAQMDLQLAVEGALQTALGGTSTAFKDSNRGLQDYVKQLQALTDVQSSAADKADALRQADDLLFGSQRNLQESMEAQARALRDRNELLQDDNFLNQKGARTLDIKTEAGARLTDALEAELKAINDTYAANIANGKSIEEATKDHDAEVKKLKDSTAAKGINQTATQHLIDIYGQVPTSRVTDFATLNFGTTSAQLQELMAYQLALKEGITLDEARARINPQIRQPGAKGNSQNAALAGGGPVRGPGTKTSDSVPAYVPGSPIAFRLSNGEFVQQAASVDYYGPEVMHALNRRRIPKGLFRLAGFAAGGVISENPVGYSPPQHYPFNVNTAATKIPSKDEVGRVVKNNLGPTGAGPGFLPWPSSPAAQRGDTGVWKSILSLVRSSGIPYTFGNAYRPGDPLWHGSGRAVDFMGYNQDTLAQFFIDRLPHVLELIHLTSKSGYFVTRGKRKANFPVQGPLHRNHLHIAMASGGMVPRLTAADYALDGQRPPGYSPAYTGAGGTQRVFTARDMAAMAQLAKQTAAGGNSYNFTFRDTTLDASRLRAIQEREAVLARTGRAR